MAVSDDCSIIAAGCSDSTISVYAFSDEVAKRKELFKLKDAHRGKTIFLERESFLNVFICINRWTFCTCYIQR